MNHYEIVLTCSSSKHYTHEEMEQITDELQKALTNKLFEFVEIQWGETS